MEREFKLARFGEGPWMDEPDSFESEYRGFKFLVYRNSMGALCGYVKLEKNHPWYGKHYDDIDADVHGGLTFSEEVESGEWVIGFDCAHHRDVVPSIEPYKKKERESLYKKFSLPYPEILNSTYKNFEFVIEEIHTLVDQAIAAEQVDEQKT